MPILYVAIAKQTVILAKHAQVPGNFDETTEQVLMHKLKHSDNKISFQHQSYYFHCINDTSSNGYIYLCVTDNDFDRSLAFSFLMDIRQLLQSNLNDNPTLLTLDFPYALNNLIGPGLQTKLNEYSDPAMDKTSAVRKQIDEVKDIMIQNIDNIANRGEKLDLLVDKTERLNDNAVTFRTTSRQVSRHMWLKNIKMTITFILVIMVILFVVLTVSCGGVTLPACRRK